MAAAHKDNRCPVLAELAELRRSAMFCLAVHTNSSVDTAGNPVMAPCTVAEQLHTTVVASVAAQYKAVQNSAENTVLPEGNTERAAH